MKIAKLQSLSKNRIRVFTDEDTSFVLYKADVAKCFGQGYELIENADIPDLAYNTIMTEILPKRAKLRAMNILMKHDKTERDLYQKLIEGYYPEDIAEAAVEYVKSFGYVDDARYVSSYASYRMDTMSRRRIEMELLKRGIGNEVISKVLDELYCDSDYDEKKTIINIAKKKCGGDIEGFVNADEKNRNKLIRYLMGRGYSYENIKHSLDITSEFI